MFKSVVLFALLAVAFAAPAPKPIANPKAKPTFYATAYTVPAAVAAPVIAYAEDLDGHVVYADEYYEPAVYTAYEILQAFYILMNMRALKGTLNNLQKNEMFQPKNLKQIKMVQPSLNEWTTLFRMFWFSGFAAMFLLSLFPLVDGTYKEFRLPFLAWYPYDTKSSPFYELMYLHQVISTYTVGVVDISADTLIAALNMYVGTQCDILCDNIRDIDGPVQEMDAKWKKCFTHHKEILKFAEHCQKFFNWIVLTQFCASVISIGLSMFQLTLVVPLSSEFFMFIFYLGAITVEIFMYCWFGNEVELKSSNILYATFEVNWVDAPQEVKKSILIFAIRCQNPIKMSSLNLFYLTLETFKAILRTSWSYFAVLRQVNARE
ncbi:Odorant receptor 46a, isoform A-like Protein [Tribolium castaneum]|uniref:Odorant receptor n=1 Tax=Tribolium castaneum TaxID=7070 RepID=A0A139WM52_TRICA|nr:Odorant receptor 46a, isoform A-like Protein [Tribolium castaneum]